MFDWNNNEPYKPTGTTSPIYIPRDTSTKMILPGEGYFFVQIRGAQAAFTGAIWEKIKRLIVTSQVSLNHPSFGTESLRAIQRSISVQKNRAEQLGMSPNVIRLVPATMSHVSISIEFILDKENNLAALGGLINDDAFLTAVSLAPGAAIVARTIGTLSQKLLQTFMKPEERAPILQFSGDFNLANGLRDGYYIILGTRDNNNPLPNPLPRLEIVNGSLLADGQQVTQLSYVIFDIQYVPARTRALNDGSAWHPKLNQAEDIASGIGNNPLATDKEKKEAWQSSLGLLKDAQVLLSADPNYLSREAQSIIKAAYATSYSQIFNQESSRSGLAFPTNAVGAETDVIADRRSLSISPDENLEETLDQYAEQVAESRSIIRAAGI
jgi:hypothetical protein